MADSSVDFMELAHCNLDSLKNQWHIYLYSGGNPSDSTFAGILALILKATPQLKKSSASFSYKIQIIASREKLSQQAIQKIYPGKESIDVKFEDNLYKYSIGNFKSYKDAKLQVAANKVEGSFIVAYLNGKRIEAATYARIPPSKPVVVHEIGVK